MPYTVAEFDALPEPEAVALLTTCCAGATWAARVAAGRPYGDRHALLDAVSVAIAGLDDHGRAEALAGHPRIGEPSESASSQREQSAVATADARMLAALAAGNRAYEDRFGHVYLVRAAGRSAAELLDILHRRLGNDPATEGAEVCSALADITRLRLERLVLDEADAASRGSLR
ncbi:2-oxo-4-hydroxy-4-carboxy-5-ureidoimidazoline decarboxylase [Rhodococcus sp. 14C212]|uniref:2-oxo-4-hydroxy-4-carboxy-5-ureidoimidazoline decarboxylase n=1 Tax=Rhodococcus sp. 14C212 TaxID=2711209 RepID=UPI0013ED5E62|nr:2-oxo-4-hydroxy-4-carboxy-5-ureidoimidazoline decarboxylase [Rhodococcus sp. 14C212]